MASTFNEMDEEDKRKKIDEYKETLRNLIISSPNSLTINQLRNDYLTFEGDGLDFKSLGFNSIIELIQNMDDVLSVSFSYYIPKFFLFICFIYYL